MPTVLASDFAGFIDSTFAGFDHAILSFYHILAELAGGMLTPIFTGISAAGNFGAVFIAAAMVMMFFKRTRFVGLAMLLAMAIGALSCDLLIKELVARARPFADQSGDYYLWWTAVGSWAEHSYSFPSGHTTAAASAMTVVFLSFKRRYRNLALFPVVLMAASRNYLMVHYPSDVLAGMLLGFVCGLLAYLIVKQVQKLLESRARAKNYEAVQSDQPSNK